MALKEIFPNDPNRWRDTDEDGVADEDDAFPNDPTQDSDRDGDGYGDNPNGNNPDEFPDILQSTKIQTMMAMVIS